MEVITVCDSRYARQAERLAISLARSNPQCELTLFCDGSAEFARLGSSHGCRVRELPEITRLGVKRAKFTAYRLALEEMGDVLYLDADIVVMSALGPIGLSRRLEAAPDDLRGCPFVGDREHPWPAEPELRNSVYINSGVMFLPAALLGFFRNLEQLAASNDCWARYILPGRLYDNHFLCAQLNRERLPVTLLDADEYNHPGFLRDGQLQVERAGNELRNRHNGKLLRLVHFAGISDVDQALCTLPLDVASLVCARSIAVTGPLAAEFVRFQAALSPLLAAPVEDSFVLRAFEVLRSQLIELAESGLTRDHAGRSSYLADADALTSLAYSLPDTTTLWNGLRCGGAYLEGDEYNFLADVVGREKVRTAVESGAGESSICLRRLGVEATSIECAEGPWLERARSAGCRTVVVPFVNDPPGFEPAALAEALAATGPAIDLLFIDSPVGTASRATLLTQFLGLLQSRLVLVHDVHRDALNVYRYQFEHDLRIVDYLASRRGLLLLGRTGADRTASAQAPAERCHHWELKVRGWPEQVAPGAEFRAEVRLVNEGPGTLSSRVAKPFRLSYHWYDAQGRIVVYDGVRTALPFEIRAGGEACFRMRAVAPSEPGCYRALVALVEEGVRWHDAGGDAQICWCDSQVRGQDA